MTAGLAIGLLQETAITIILMLCLLFNIVLHTFYDAYESFIFNPHINFILIALIALGFVGEKKYFYRIRYIMLVVIAIATIFINLRFFDELVLMLPRL